MSVPADRRVWQEAITLREAGYEVDVVCPVGAARDSSPYELRDGVRIHRYPAHPSVGGIIGYAKEYASALRNIRRTIRGIGKDQPFDVIQVCNPPDFLWLAVIAEKRKGTKIIFDHHDLSPELYATRFGDGRMPMAVLRLLERSAFATAEVVISTNESYRAIARRRGRKKLDDVFVVRNAPDLVRFHEVDRQPDLARDQAFLIAYVGVMGPQDGVDNALRALFELFQTRRDWYAVFLGDGTERGRLTALASELGLADHVDFPGWADDDTILPLLSTADICLSPEGPNPLNGVSTMMKVAEYMALGRPVVAFDLLETRRTAGDAAVYAAPDDVPGYSRCIDELLSDAPRRAQMGAVGLERVRAKLSWQVSSEALIAAYRRTTGG
jgi:glycosyltransferase involved in cell wall biosynthesis